MDEIQAAILSVKLKYVDSENSRRANIAEIYDKNITTSHVVKPTILHDCKQVWHQYVLQVENRDAFRSYLLDNGIETDVHYPTPPHLQPCYQRYKNNQLPKAVNLANSVVSLPISTNVGEQEALYICETINKYS